jgi:hypothetical protein
MSNYSKWDKFDPDLVCKEIDVQQSIESSKAAKKKAFTATATESEHSIIAAKKAAEALQSQVDLCVFNLDVVAFDNLYLTALSFRLMLQP